MEERTVAFNGHQARVWEQGSGKPVVFVAGFMGLPLWIPFLDHLAEHRRVIVPSLPGFPGATGHRDLDDLSDWVNATLEIIEAAAGGPVDTVASSVGAALVLEAAAVNRTLFRRLALIAPFGVYDDQAPGIDPWAQPPGSSAYPALLCARPERFEALWTKPNGVDEVEWQILQVRGLEASARFLWPLGDTGILKRAYRLVQPMLLLRGSKDRVVPRSYLEKLHHAVPGDVTLQEIAGAGHLVELDAPEQLAAAIRQFLD